jgi:hypothetical protein
MVLLQLCDDKFLISFVGNNNRFHDKHPKCC